MAENQKGAAQLLEQAVDRISALTQVQRIIICAAVFVLVVGGFVFLFYKPALEEKSELSTQVDDLKRSVANYKREAAKLDTFKARKEEVELQYQQGLRLLPNQREVPALLAGISKSGQDSNLEFLRFQPHGEVVKDVFSEMPVSIEVVGSYHNIAMFFDRVSKLFRIVNIRDVRIAPERGGPPGQFSGNLVASLQAVTYRFIEPSKPGEIKSE
ncbi:MAG: type 4a pilus biogenesis protein PilO [Desulfatibacillaceae bacterium]|nr:type 4a pilus biogenesis protein PilO [Desulfatibacillaceae bacterium]